MALKFKVTDTKTVLLQLLICLMTFYAAYYIIGSIFFGVFRLETYDVLIPFDFKTEPSCPNSKYMVNLISMEMTYFVCGLLFAGVVEECVWDYAITVTLIHIAVTSIVMAEFPLVWHWWLALGCALTIMICSGHLLVHFAFQDNLIYPLLDDF
ncbi:putative transmembrane protein 244 isoform X1 [Chiloscyllium punctatum]